MGTEKYNQLKTKLERKILLGLSLEWENIWNGLPAEHRNRLQRPSFALSAMQSTLGYWAPKQSQIVLSRQFVLNHPWDAVKEVLQHEMAHQLAEGLAHRNSPKPHGKTFIKACDIIGANPKASGHYLPLDERLWQNEFCQEDRLLLKVKKLLALAHSNNRHEAEAAMAKAQQFIEKYNLNLITHDRQRSFISVFIGAPALRHFREEYHLASLLNDFYFVYGIWVPAFVIDKAKMGRVLEISGLAKNIQLAHYTYTYVKRYIDVQWAIFNKGKGFSRYRKTDYAIGIIEGFRRKLLKSRSSMGTAPTNRELSLIRDDQLEAYMCRRYPRIRSYRKRVNTFNESIWLEGLDAGERLVIAKGINEKRSAKATPLLSLDD